MKLNQVLLHTNQIERSKFANCIDRICQEIKSDKEISKQLEKINGQIKSASGNEITEIFNLVRTHFKKFIQEQLSLGGPQVSLLINILVRDGNCVASIPWIENLYSAEYKKIDTLSKYINSLIQEEDSGEYDLTAKLKIYHDCVFTAFENDARLNREKKISEDERTILNVLSAHLGLSRDEVSAIEHLINPIPELGIEDSIEYLREIGILLVCKRRSEIMLPDEIVEILHSILGKELRSKYELRILRSLTDAELSNILKNHGYKTRGIDRPEKIQTISRIGIPIRSILSNDIYAEGLTQNQKKERIKQIIEDMDATVPRLGSRLQERIDVIIEYFNNLDEDEFNVLSVSGFKELLEKLANTSPSIEERIRSDFEVENKEVIDPEKLKALGITPRDILYLYTNDEVKCLRTEMGLPRKGNPRSQIIDSFASADDKLIENYHLLASRDIQGLSSLGMEIKEAEIGIKFEETTRSIFEELNLVVDEELRKSINTAKDKTDIIVSLGNDGIIIGEAKSYKNGEYAKYSSTSRQVKSYVKRCEDQGHRVAQVLIVAPAFSKDFIDAAEMDAEVNISLLEAEGLQKILNAYKQKRKPNFSPRLLTKGGLLKADLIAKSI